MDIKEKYLQNPFVTITPELRAKLGITSQDMKRRERMLENRTPGPAIELDNEPLPIRQEVIVRKRKDDGDSRTQTN